MKYEKEEYTPPPPPFSHHTSPTTPIPRRVRAERAFLTKHTAHTTTHSPKLSRAANQTLNNSTMEHSVQHSAFSSVRTPSVMNSGPSKGLITLPALRPFELTKN